MRDSLDGIWLGFANNTEIKGNVIANMRNHGVISLNSRGNTVSGNQIINSNEGIYFYSEEYDRNEFSFLPPGDYTSHDNCLCGNTLQNNAIAIHLRDSVRNQVTGNNYLNNNRNVLTQGRNDGNNIQAYWQFPLTGLVARVPRW
jgi:parallel beta-helix repeat protein